MKFAKAEDIHGALDKIDGGCWLWKGKRDKNSMKSGHVSTPDFPGESRAHRVLFALAHPEIKISDVNITSKCGEQLCCNPEHYFVSFIREGTGWHGR